MTQISSSTSSISNSYLLKLVGKLDTNSDGSVSKSEFVSGRPSDQSESLAGSLFDSLDSSGSGAVSVTDLATVFQQMDNATQSALIAAQAQASTGGGGGEPPDPSEMFSDLDSDGDGVVTQAEFVAGRPDDVSEEQATAFYNRLAGDQADSGLSESDLASALEQDAASRGGSTATASTGSSTSQNGESQAALLQELLRAISSYQQGSYASILGASSGTSVAA